MKQCPNCGVELPANQTRVGSAVLGTFLDSIGGPEKYGKTLARDFEESSGNTRSSYHYQIRDLIKNEDQANAQEKHNERMEQAQERAILMEHALWLIEHDEEFLPKVLEIHQKRKKRLVNYG